MRLALKILIPLTIVMLAVFFYRRALTVTVPVAEARLGTAIHAVTGTVEVLSYADIMVKAENRGQITEMVVKPGQVVEKGDVIAIQNSEDLDLRIEQIEIRLEASEAREALESVHSLDVASYDAELEALELAVKLNQRPASQLEKMRRDRRKSEILVELEAIQERENRRFLETQLEQLKLQRENNTTRAPFAGIVATVNAFKGDLVNGGQNLVRLVAHGRFLMMKLTEEDYFGVADGQSVTLRLASYPDRTYAGKVTRMEDVANASDKTRNVIVTVEAPDSEMVPGLTGEGYLIKAERPKAVLIPRRALMGDRVTVVVNGKAEKRRVRPGFLGLRDAEILEGIEPGDRVVLESQNLLQDGQSVRTTEIDDR
jgi:RND family efflux transporter MFP subunit